MGSQHEEGLLFAAECKRMEETIGDTHMNSFWNLDKKEIYCIFKTCCIMSVFYKMSFLFDVPTSHFVIS
jgi:hypothetical protein